MRDNRAIAFGIAAADFDGDDKPDLAVADGENFAVFGNQWPVFEEFDGSPHAVVSSATVLAAQVVGDAAIDLVVTGVGLLDIWEGDGAGGFTFAKAIAVPAEHTTGGVAVASLNCDDVPDLVATFNHLGVSQARRIAGPSFDSFDALDVGAVGEIYSVGSGRFSDDTWPDLVFPVFTISGGSVSVVPRTVNCQDFDAAQVFSSGGDGVYSLAIGDIDGDGLDDAAVGESPSERIVLFYGGSPDGLDDRDLGDADDSVPLDIDVIAEKIATTDLDHNNRLDIVAVTPTSGDDVFLTVLLGD